MLTGKLIGLAKACQTKPKTDNTDRIILYILTELGHADFLADDNEKIKLLEDIIEGEKRKLYRIVPIVPIPAAIPRPTI